MAADGRKAFLFLRLMIYLDELINLGFVDLGSCESEAKPFGCHFFPDFDSKKHLKKQVCICLGIV